MIRLSFRDGITTIADRRHSVHLYPSILSDALGDLTRATIGLLREAERLTIAWQDEPGEWRWLLAREGDQLRIRILRFDKTFCRQADERGTPIFETTCRLADFAGQLKSELQRLLDELGPEGYRAEWKRPFPLADYETLSQLIRRRRRPTIDAQA